MAALDSVMCVLIENYKKVDSLNLRERYAKLQADTDFIEYTKFNTTDYKTVTGRIGRVEEIMLK